MSKLIDKNILKYHKYLQRTFRIDPISKKDGYYTNETYRFKDLIKIIYEVDEYVKKFISKNRDKSNKESIKKYHDKYIHTNMLYEKSQNDLSSLQYMLKIKNKKLRHSLKEREEMTSKLKDITSKLKDITSKLKDTEYELKDTKSELKNTKYELKDTEYELKDTEYELKDTKSKLQKKRKRFCFF